MNNQKFTVDHYFIYLLNFIEDSEKYKRGIKLKHTKLITQEISKDFSIERRFCILLALTD